MKGLTLLVITALLAAGPLQSETIDWRTSHNSVTPQNFDEGGDVSRHFHLHAAAYLPTATIAHSRSPDPLRISVNQAVARQPVKHAGGRSAFAQYVDENPYVDAVIVLHEGAVAFEAYPRMQPWQRHFAWSVSKVVTGATLAALVAEGRVDPDEVIDAYVPEFRGTAWEGTSVRDVANMASGIDCLDSDGYQSRDTCIYRLEESLGITAPAGYDTGFIAHMRGMQRHREPGTRNEYVSANTMAVMLVVEAVTGLPFSSALQTLIWEHLGPEADALIPVNKAGYAYAAGGVTARLRDVARFGHMFVEPSAHGIITREIVEDIQGDNGIELTAEKIEELAEQFGDDLPVRSAWQWDLVWEDGAMFKSGYLGQGLYVDPERRLVIAWFGTGDDYNETNHELEPIARQLARSGIF